MQYADIAIAVVIVLVVAWIADMITGRRGYFAASLVSGCGAICGWFLVVRVFAVLTQDDWRWIGWSLCGSAISLVAYYLFRSKR